VLLVQMEKFQTSMAKDALTLFQIVQMSSKHLKIQVMVLMRRDISVLSVLLDSIGIQMQDYVLNVIL